MKLSNLKISSHISNTDIAVIIAVHWENIKRSIMLYNVHTDKM